MLITLEKWEQIRNNFDDSEKNQLNQFIIGETICPRGCVVDEGKLHPELLKKLYLYNSNEGETKW